MIGQQSMNLLERLGGIIEMGQRVAKGTTLLSGFRKTGLSFGLGKSGYAQSRIGTLAAANK
jgi:hypothetical protein